MLGFPLLYFKGVRLMMFQLSSFYCRGYRVSGVSLLFGIRFRASGDVEDSTKPLDS